MTANESYAGQVDRYVIALEEAYDKAETAGAVDGLSLIYLRGSVRPMDQERSDDSASGKGGRPGVGPSDSQPTGFRHNRSEK